MNADDKLRAILYLLLREYRMGGDVTCVTNDAITAIKQLVEEFGGQNDAGG
jgi:hypothetical protein